VGAPFSQSNFLNNLSFALDSLSGRAFYDRFGGGIPIKEEVIIEMTAKNIEEQPEMSSDETINGEIEYSQWPDRDDMWWASR